MIYTVFYDEDSGYLPEDFATRNEAEEAAQERIRYGMVDSYEIQSTEGEVIQ